MGEDKKRLTRYDTVEIAKNIERGFVNYVLIIINKL